MNVIVVGAGAAGCTAAWSLRKAGIDVIHLERESEIGGRTRTIKRDGYEIDRGAAFITSRYRSTLRLIDELGRRDELTRWKPKIGFRDGEQINYLKPDSMWSRMTFKPIGAAAGWKLTREILRSTPDIFDSADLANADDGRSTAEWGPDAVGEDGYQFGVRTAVEPFWGATPEDVPAAAARGVLGSSLGEKLLQLPGGIGTLCEWLSEDEVRTNATVERVQTRGEQVRITLAGGESIDADGVIVATDAVTASELIDFDDACIKELGRYSYAANLHVALAFEEEVWSSTSGDLVFEVGAGERTITSYAPLSRRRPAGPPAGAELIDVYFGDRASRAIESDRAVELSIESIERHLGSALPEALFVEVIYQPRALSVPRPGELPKRSPLNLPSTIKLAGDHRAMASVETAVRTGEEAAASFVG